MWDYINYVLLLFVDCFSNGEALRWFICIIIGMMIRSDNLGVTSIIRALDIEPRRYEALLHFFRAKSWVLSDIRAKWITIIAHSGLLYRVNGKPVLIGDGVKQSKEGKKMPGVKRLFQESENSGKPQFMFGHMFGCIGTLLGDAKKIFCTPLSMTLQDGNEVTGEWGNDPLAKESHVVRLVHEACSIASYIGSSILLLDRYFLTVPALKSWLEGIKKYAVSVTIVVKAKINYTAYEILQPTAQDKKKPGRPRKKGASVKLKTLFTSHAKQFTQTVLTLYGKQTTVSYLCIDLLWGAKLYHPLRFVLVRIKGMNDSILACKDLSMPAETIIELYSLRFKIESCFRAFKQTISGFAYHFWSVAMPKLNRYKKNEAAQAELKKVEDKAQQSVILSAVKAIEGFIMFACIAQGLLQICALKFAGKYDAHLIRWLRTKRSAIHSEGTVADYLRKTILGRQHMDADLPIRRLIQGVQKSDPSNPDEGIA